VRSVNFLAHLYLSGPEPDVMVGNFIGDFVRGRDIEKRLGPGVAKGVALHRAIDAFTDGHEVVKRSKSRLWPKYRHYSAVIVDVYYDHYLAALWNDYSPESLTGFAARSYQVLLEREPVLPERVRRMLPHVMGGNWLVNYAHVEGIRRALSGMSRRTTFKSNMEHSADDLTAHYASFRSDFQLFFPALEAFAKDWLAVSTDPESRDPGSRL
jgi:acyl carrier protein phosphodiesterase